MLYGPTNSGKKTLFNYIYHNNFSKKINSIKRFDTIYGKVISFELIRIGKNYVAFELCMYEELYGDEMCVIEQTDGILFVWDSLISQCNHNIASLNELLSNNRKIIIQNEGYEYPEISFVLCANKKDEMEIVDLSEIRKVLDKKKLDGTLIYETVALIGDNLKRALTYVSRTAFLSYSERNRPKNYDLRKEIESTGLKDLMKKIRETPDLTESDLERKLKDIKGRESMLKNDPYSVMTFITNVDHLFRDIKSKLTLQMHRKNREILIKKYENLKKLTIAAIKRLTSGKLNYLKISYNFVDYVTEFPSLNEMINFLTNFDKNSTDFISEFKNVKQRSTNLKKLREYFSNKQNLYDSIKLERIYEENPFFNPKDIIEFLENNIDFRNLNQLLTKNSVYYNS